MSRDTLNGTLVSRFADFTGVSWSSALPQFAKTERSGATDLACSQIGTFGTTSSIILCEFLLRFDGALSFVPPSFLRGGVSSSLPSPSLSGRQSQLSHRKMGHHPSWILPSGPARLITGLMIPQRPSHRPQRFLMLASASWNWRLQELQ